MSEEYADGSLVESIGQLNEISGRQAIYISRIYRLVTDSRDLGRGGGRRLYPIVEFLSAKECKVMGEERKKKKKEQMKTKSWK